MLSDWTARHRQDCNRLAVDAATREGPSRNPMLEQLVPWVTALRPTMERAMIVALQLYKPAARARTGEYWRLSLGVTAALDADGHNRYELENASLDQQPVTGKERQFDTFKRDLAQMEASSPQQMPAGTHYFLLVVEVRPTDDRRRDSWLTVMPIFPWTIDDLLGGPVLPQREWINILRRGAGGADELWGYRGLDIQIDGVSRPELVWIHGGERGAQGGPRQKAWRALRAKEATADAEARV